MLTERFSDDELQALSFDLGIDYRGLPGDGKVARVRELVAYLDRRRLLAEPVRLGKQQRPDIA